MKRILFFIFFIFSSSVFSQLPNLNPSTQDDAFLLDYFFNKQQNSNINKNSSSSFTDNDLYYLGKNNDRDFFILKSSIEKDNDLKGISHLILINSSVPQYVNDKTYFSSVAGGIIFCEFPRIRVLSRTYYSKENLNGNEVFVDDKNLMIRENSIKSDPIFQKIKQYLCR